MTFLLFWIGLFIFGLNIISEVKGSLRNCSLSSKGYDVYGTLTSPNYPDNYPDNISCSRMINVSTGHVLYIMFSAFNLENDSKCAKDYMKIYDGNTLKTTGSNFNGRFCGNRDINSFISNTNSVRIEIHTDGSVVRSGFNLSWLKIRIPRNCGDSLNASHLYSAATGIISSPNYPNNYPINLDCYWIITKSDQKKILYLKFSAFNLEDSDKCVFDYVEIYDGIRTLDHNSFVDGKLCGDSNVTASPLILTSKSILIKFHSDISLKTSGFSLSWNQLSPTCSNISLNTHEQMNCTNGYKIGSTCTFSCSSGYKLVGHSSSTCAVAESSVFWSPSQPKCRRYSSICYVDSSSTDVVGGTIYSPNYPEIYPHNLDCTHTINAATGNVLYIMFSTFDLDFHHGCVSDYMNIYDGDTARTFKSTYNGKFCGKQEIDAFVSTSRSVRIVFHADSWGARSGFSVSWLQIPSSRNCVATKRHFYSTSGTLSSPHYPEDYSNVIDCNWIITRSPGKILYALFTTFNFMETTECQEHYIKIYDGINAKMNDTLHHENVCNRSDQTITRELVLKSSSVLILYHVDWSMSQIGFTLDWQHIPPTCPTISPTTHLQMSCTNGYKIGSVCNFNCSSGTRMIGILSSLTCRVLRGRVVWSHVIPKCQEFHNP